MKALALSLAAAVGIAVATPAVADVPPYPLVPPAYSQKSPWWGHVMIGRQRDVPMRTMGSLITAMAIVAGAFGLQAKWDIYGDATPDYIHHYLWETGGYYDQSPAKTVIVDYHGLRRAFYTPDFVPAGLHFVRRSWGPATRALVDEDLAEGTPTILYLNKGPDQWHPVVAIAWDTSSQSYWVLDPARPPSHQYPVTLAELFRGGWEQMISGALLTGLWLESDGTPRPAPLEVSTKSPVEIVAIDPQGRRVGWDATTGTTVIDVPGASYGPQPVWSDPTGVLAPRAPGRLLTIPEPVDGRWRFAMIATGDGPYTLNVRAYDAGGDMTVREGYAGTVTTGDVVKFQIEYARNGASHFTIGDNFTPQAEAGPIRRTTAGSSVSFDGGPSFDVDGTIVSYAWDFGDGSSASGATATHAYAVAGSYTATLKVHDDEGLSQTDTVEVAVYGDQPFDGTTERASLGTGGLESAGDRGSFTPAMSGDGRFVTFFSWANNFGSDSGGVFIRDRQTGATELVHAMCARGEGFSDVSDDGRFVAFECAVQDPVTTLGLARILVRDRVTGIDERVDVASDGTPGWCDVGAGCGSYRPAMSPDGRFVAFYSDHPNLVPGDTNGRRDAFVHDRQTGSTERVSLTHDGAQAAEGAGDAYVERLGISADGRFVAFNSMAPDLAEDTPPYVADRIYVRDRLLQTTELVSVPTEGAPGPLTGGHGPSISDDGRIVAFASGSNDLVPGDTNGEPDVFVHDRQTGVTERVTLNGAGAQADCSGFYEGDPYECNRDPVVSGDGRFVVFRSNDDDLVLSDDNDQEDVFVRDRVTGTTEIVSVSTEGVQGDGSSGEAYFTGDPTCMAVSDDGRFVAFSSDATTLVGADANGEEDVFVRDRRPPGLIADASGPYVGWAGPAHVAFDASASFDPLGGALTARWDFGDGSPVVEAPVATIVAHAFAQAGDYTVTLVVTSGEKESAPVTTVAHIQASRPPSLTPMSACGAPGGRLAMAIDAHPLVPRAGGWNLGSAPLPAVRAAHPSDTVRLVVDGPAAGEHVVPIDAFTAASALEYGTRFTLDAGGGWPAGTYSVTAPDEADAPSATFVVPCPALPNMPPQADVGGPYQGVVGVPVVLDGRGSVDPEGAPLAYEWWIHDAEASGATPSRVFTEPGVYEVALVVDDGEHESPTSVGTNSWTTVTITDAPPVPAVIDLVAEATTDAILLAWTCVDVASTYDVERGTTPGGPYARIATGRKTCGYEDRAVDHGTEYYYRVIAVHASGAVSPPSNEARGQLLATPVDPCTDEPRAATFRSLGCRLAELRARTLAVVVGADVQRPFLRNLDRARDRLGKARATCAAGKRRPPRAALRGVAKHVGRLARRLKKWSTRTVIPASAGVVEVARAIRADAVALQRDLRCPGDAQ